MTRAGFVKITTPHVTGQLCRICWLRLRDGAVTSRDLCAVLFSITALAPIVRAKRGLTPNSLCDIFIFTLISASGGGGARQGSHPRGKQRRCSPATGHLEPAPARCDASTLPGQRILRFSGSGPGQVRDAARSSGGEQVREPVGGRVRFLAAVVLSSAGSLRTRRTLWIDSPQTRATQCPQAYAGSHGICGRGSAC